MKGGIKKIPKKFKFEVKLKKNQQENIQKVYVKKQKRLFTEIYNKNILSTLYVLTLNPYN